MAIPVKHCKTRMSSFSSQFSHLVLGLHIYKYIYICKCKDKSTSVSKYTPKLIMYFSAVTSN